MLLLRRYLKLASEYCERHGLMDLSLAAARGKRPPFDLGFLPREDEFLNLKELALWVKPKRGRRRQRRTT